MITLNDTELLHRLVRGDADAFRSIYEQHQGQVFSFALHYTKSKEIAEEAVQEVFIRLWEKRAQLENVKEIFPFIKVMVRNQVLDTWRKAARDKSLLKRIHSNMRLLNQQPAEILIDKQLEALYREAIGKLPAQRRLIYILHRDEGLSYEQIAAKLGISKSTVKGQMSDAIHSVHDYVTGHPDLSCLIIASVFFHQ